MGTNKVGLIAVLALGGATALFFLTKKKTVTGSSGIVNNPATVIKNADGTTTAKAGDIITNSGGVVTDTSGNAVNVDTMTDQQRQDLINALNAQNDAVAAAGLNLPYQGTTNGIWTDLYNTYLANKAGYAAADKPAPIQYDNTVPGQVTVIPYSDPTHPVTYADPTGTLTFTNIGGTAVPNDPNAVIINNVTPPIAAAPTTQNQNVPSSGPGNTAVSPSIPASVAADNSVITPAIAAEAAENIALAANPGNAPVNTDSEGNQYVTNNEGEAVYLGVPTFADNLAAVPGMTQDASGVWHWNGL
jgi:hypothetical protein